MFFFENGIVFLVDQVPSTMGSYAGLYKQIYFTHSKKSALISAAGSLAYIINHWIFGPRQFSPFKLDILQKFKTKSKNIVSDSVCLGSKRK